MEEKKQVTKPITIQAAENSRIVWSLTPTLEVEPEDMLDPNYWAHIAKRLRSGHIIEAVPEDMRYFAEFIVVASATNWAKVRILRIVKLVKEDEMEDIDGYSVKWGRRDKWRVLAGNEVISKGHADKETAMNSLNDHLKALK